MREPAGRGAPGGSVGGQGSKVGLGLVELDRVVNGQPSALVAELDHGMVDLSDVAGDVGLGPMDVLASLIDPAPSHGEPGLGRWAVGLTAALAASSAAIGDGKANLPGSEPDRRHGCNRAHHGRHQPHVHGFQTLCERSAHAHAVLRSLGSLRLMCSGVRGLAQ